MPKISRTTNPTSLKELDSKNFLLRTQISANGKRLFWLERFDFAASQLSPGLRMDCVAHAGNTEEYFQLGVVEKPSCDSHQINDLALDHPLKFRFLVYEQGNPRLVAAAENIRSADESGTLGDSLVDIECADLKGAAWKLTLPNDEAGADKPVLQVEKMLFPTPLAAAKDRWIAVLVMPEVMRKIAEVIAENFDLDNPESWTSGWRDFILGMGVPELVDDPDDLQRDNWVEDVVSAFCSRPAMKHQFKEAVADLNG